MSFFTRKSEPQSARGARGPGSKPELKVELLETRAVPAIIVGPNINVTQKTGEHTEVDIAVNPANPQNIIVAPIDINSISGPLGVDVVWTSFDGGNSWTEVNIPNPAGTTFANGDPALIFDRFGRVVYSHLVNDTNGGLGIATAVSTDGGLTWGNPVLVTTPGTFNDKNWIGVGPDKNNLAVDRFYMTWHVNGTIFSTSSSDGVVWNTPVAVSDAGNEGIFSMHAVVSATGDVSMVWQTVVDPGGNRVMYDRSTDGGLTWGADVTVATTDINSFSDPLSGGGRYSIPPKPFRGVPIGPVMDIDNSAGPNSGRIYIAFVDQADRDGNQLTSHDDTDIFLVASDDGGATWNALGAPKRVNDDATTNSQFQPWLDVDPITGTVGLIWYDARDSANNTQVAVYIDASMDGGVTFNGNTRVSTGLSDQSLSNPNASFFDYGEYIGLEIINNVAYMVWSDNSNSTGDNPDGNLNLTDSVFARAQIEQDEVATLLIEPVTSVNPTGTLHTIRATALSATGRPLSNVVVDFLFDPMSVNSILSGSAVTDANGVATFTYVSNVSGLDIIRAQSGTVTSAPVTKLWVTQASLSGSVYIDANNNGLFDPGELPIPSTTVILSGTDAFGNAVNRTALTDAAGSFTFQFLLPSNATGYTLTEIHPAAYLDGKDTAGTAGGIVGNDVITNIVLPEGVPATGYLFGELGLAPSFISKRLFFASTTNPTIPGTVQTPGEVFNVFAAGGARRESAVSGTAVSTLSNRVVSASDMAMAKSSVDESASLQPLVRSGDTKSDARHERYHETSQDVISISNTTRVFKSHLKPGVVDSVFTDMKDAA